MTTKRNIHGSWKMSFNNRILTSEFTGPSNREGSEAWFEDLKNLILSSPDQDSSPWVMLNDVRDWQMASLDSWGTNNHIIDWMSKHQCALFAIVFSKKIQSFSVEKGINDKSIVQFFFDHEAAYQACREKLSDAQK